MTAAGLPAGGVLSIGAVLSRLQPEFPDVTISKIRFLESEGLVTPQRTPAGYRQFSHADVERLRYVLAAQREQYLPLKVIKDHLEAIDRGVTPDSGGGRVPRGLALAGAADLPDFASRSIVRMTRAELLAESGLADAQLSEIEQFGLLHPGAGGFYDADSAILARTVGELVEAGIEPRHLRPFRAAADREAALVSQMVSAQARQKNPDARERAEQAAGQLAASLLRLHALLVKSGIHRELGN
ncbi:MerR family transcriptional regulator [Nakamurella antarctica]|uniref:MerR family transcriptional regulator n=1 Tax=Nakamurella antarctica TaxID=1902245 RepID=A0A3G8ZK99_9ACTN|nr:MerR family transcriptional regulator [Nakamurella antarctica]AZI57630.1 MerR family transcriptional regulator [Nakamurella antarctica]